jgi:hypothetical protein
VLPERTKIGFVCFTKELFVFGLGKNQKSPRMIVLPDGFSSSQGLPLAMDDFVCDLYKGNTFDLAI